MKTINKLLRINKKKPGPVKKETPKRKGQQKGDAKGAGVKPAHRPETSAAAPMTIKDLLKPSPTFQETPQNGRVRLFIEKLRLCCVMFDWPKDGNHSQTDSRGIEIKRQLLLELVDFVGKSKAVFSEHVVVEIMKMVTLNLFRNLPPKVHKDMIDPEEEEPVFEAAWPHLQIVYEFFLRFIVSGDLDVRLMRKFITIKFVNNLLGLFDSEDPRERDYLKTILHRIYAKFMMLRAFIRKSINTAFYNFIYETERHNGVAELLEILGSIINGFALPLKEEHKQFFKTALIPMHKVKPLHVFHRQLSYCVTQFVDKDHTLATDAIIGLLKYWPVLNSQKELLFLNELEEILELTQPEEFEMVYKILFKRIGGAIGSPHFQIAERALFFWHNEYISSLIADYRKDILPIIFPALQVNSQNHWNQTVSTLTLNVLKIFVDIDSNLVEECSKAFEIEQERNEEKKKKRAERWALIMKGG
uniref:Serine/threonine protein phosphatase 2A regulatory subunit n=1 Tax=Lotharella oceanica TaxID=641309 RepID=A0A7S2TWZ1_9EUKA|mmetsp:Transcript_33612/g.62466  ORF Transcript_33612/g.62466 Transcript_33612/m.62466 type:complete len:473 (+) Transcript_33612:91-1509(+)|eukprot:CAMPEP_0170169040 /NCGR_PEP_ID=MMETSP0040_2-20121228/1979_1 /TAXON_ID=641309 /ORGANISM="Lotharella oceanica, Strain CCMP622" /LENGTH=472 /DNA_ID=CAMNT_0010407555 /DNA_START=64 /DNA_END=1482 /DNA_ORIENTATION=-